MTKEKILCEETERPAKEIIETSFGDEAEKRAKELGEPIFCIKIFDDGKDVSVYVEGAVDEANEELLAKALMTICEAYGVTCSFSKCMSSIMEAEITAEGES